MKRIQNLMLICILFTNIIVAQQKKSITVIGETIKTTEIEKYVVNIEFKEIISDNYQNIKGKTVSELKKEFASMLSKENINFGFFKEDVNYHLNSYLYTSSAYYFYVTTSLEEVQKILSQKMKGVDNTRVDFIAKEMTNKQIGELSKKAIDDARKSAEQIASKIGKTVGEITQIENTNYKYEYFNVSGVRGVPLKYHIKVTFSLQ
ncbi:SIMPL domain-containing protein [Flavivirga algicola]|uniref:SIMPL domain-containing protein n=1 Tax=Flavivirga algicola TaxID=2729136 RepID=A0ABX1RZX0_9FLAO|nr:SIMPL domain-containing protein [Flavivirga algicola]NMH89142.1 SIMPL domain-containing protein [Flavivirga algicola]